MILTKLIDRLRKKPKHFIADLTKEQREELRSLTFTPGWTTYLDLISSAMDHNARAMLNTSIDAEVHCFRGLVLGLELGPILVDSIINKKDAQDERESERARLAEQRARSDTTLYGTSLWIHIG